MSEAGSVDDEVVRGVCRCVARVLALNAEELKASDRLMDDLGAESLDLVELMYVIEDEFKIRLERADISLTAQLGLPEAEVHENEVLTDKALQALRDRFPDAASMLIQGVTRKHLAVLVTIGEIARAVRSKVERITP